MTTAPAYIARDTYTGRWTIARSAATMTARGHIVGVDTAAELARRFGASGAVFTLWEFTGRNHAGQFLFHRSRFVADSAGNLHSYDANGRAVLTHPADRDVRYLGSR